MRRQLALIFLGLLGASPALAGRPHCTLRVHLETNANDGASFSTAWHAPASGRNVNLEKTPAISERDVVAYRPYPAAVDGSFGALLQLDDHGRLALDTLSVERRGGFLHLFVNGRPVAELQIDRRVRDGKLYIASGLTRADLELMKKDWPLIGRRKP